MAEWLLIEARPDWLTATATDPTRAHALLVTGLDIIREEEEAGHDRRSRSWMGYRGTATDHAFVGWRPDGACVRLGADRAGLHWRAIADVSDRTTRMDLCVTAQGPPGEAGYAAESSAAVRQRKSIRGRPNLSAYLENSDGGATLYCGRRSSQRFGRLYRKDIEQPGNYPAFSWRWEVEYKQELAAAVLDKVAASPEPGGACAQLVAAEFARWGAALPGELHLSVESIPRASRPPTDSEKRLAWLSSSVRSAIAKAGRTHKAADIIAALGIEAMDAQDVLDLTRID